MALTLLAGLCSLALLPAGKAQGQNVPQVYTDHRTGLLVYIAELPGRQPGQVVLGHVSGIYWFFNPFSPLEPGFGCRFISPVFPSLLQCDPPVNGFLVQLGPGPNDVRVLPTLPDLPGPNVINGNKGNDKIKGGQNDEQINGGKGHDVIDPGPGEDDVNAGPGDDKINSRDGEVDLIDGGKGHDVAEVDKQDKVRNVEVVRRK